MVSWDRMNQAEIQNPAPERIGGVRFNFLEYFRIIPTRGSRQCLRLFSSFVFIASFLITGGCIFYKNTNKKGWFP